MEHALDLSELAQARGREEKWSIGRAGAFNTLVRKLRTMTWARFIEDQYEVRLTRHQVTGDLSLTGPTPWTALPRRSRDAYLSGTQAPGQAAREKFGKHFPGSNEIYLHLLWDSLLAGTPVEDLARMAIQFGGLGLIDGISDVLQEPRLHGAGSLSRWMDMAALLSCCARLSLYLEQRQAPFRYCQLLLQVVVYLCSLPGFRENFPSFLRLFRLGFAGEITSDDCKVSSRPATYEAVSDISRCVVDTAIFIAGGNARVALASPISLLTIVDILHPYVLAMMSPGDAAYGNMMELLSRSRQPDMESRFVEARNELEANPVFGGANKRPPSIPKKSRRRYFGPLNQ